VHVHDAFRLAVQVDHPVERGIAAAEDHQPLAVEVGCIAHPVVDLPVLERVGALDAEPARLEGAEAGGDHDRPCQEARAGRGAEVEAAVLAPLQLDDFLAEMKLRAERLDLLEQPVDEFLGAAHRHGRDVVDGLVRIQLGALAARVPQGVHDVGLDAQQPQLERLEQAGRPRPDDDGIGLDRARTGCYAVCHDPLQAKSTSKAGF
jgi:hypothetical protein